MPGVATLPPLSSLTGPAGDSFEKFFDEVIASPEMNLLDDVFAEEMDQKPVIHHLPPPSHSTHSYHPMLHRLQPVPPPSLSILKSHIRPNPTPTSAGGISPTLTWSGDPSPIDHDASPTLNDTADLDGEEWKPSSVSSAGSGGAPPSLFTRSDSRGREGRPVRDASQSHSRSHSSGKRSTRSSSASNSADGGDELTMSALSIVPPTTGSPGATAHTPRPSNSPARKKSRTTSSSGSSISSIDALISEAMGSNTVNRLIPTGHRRNITSASLVPLDAPTQIRNYLTPSSTSKKEIPSAFVARRNKLKAKEVAVTPSTSSAPSGSRPTTGRKRTREEAGLKTEEGDDTVDQLQDDDTPNDQSQSQSVASPVSPVEVAAELASESSSLLSAIEAKRRQNTLAARRSRQRKLDYVRNLEELVAALTKERDNWKGRAEAAEKVLGYRPAEDDMDEDEDEDE